jgi:hypothetical protein
MATQPLSQEDAIYTPDSDLPIEFHLVTPSTRKTSARNGILLQLQICRESLIALQSQSQELHQRMADLMAIAEEMGELQPSGITEPVPGSEMVKQIATQQIAFQVIASQKRSAFGLSQDSKNYWGGEPTVTAAIAFANSP